MQSTTIVADLTLFRMVCFELCTGGGGGGGESPSSIFSAKIMLKASMHVDQVILNGLRKSILKNLVFYLLTSSFFLWCNRFSAKYRLMLKPLTKEFQQSFFNYFLIFR